MITFVLYCVVLTLSAVFTWLTIKDVSDKTYYKGYEKGYRRALHEGYEKGYKDGKAAGMKSTAVEVKP